MNGVLYALGDTHHLYTINTTTGAATLVTGRYYRQGDSLQFELGFRGKLFSYLTFDVGGFYYTFDDQIGLVAVRTPDHGSDPRGVARPDHGRTGAIGEDEGRRAVGLVGHVAESLDADVRLIMEM